MSKIFYRGILQQRSARRLVYEDAGGLGTDVVFGCVEITLVLVALAPRIFDDVILVVPGVAGGADEVHTVVVGGVSVEKVGLTALLRYVDLNARGGESAGAEYLFFGRQLLEILDVGGLHACGVDAGQERVAVVVAKTFFGNVRRPQHRVSHGERRVYDGHHLVETHVEKQAVAPVVGEFNHAEFAKVVVAKRRYLHVVAHVEFYDFLGEGFGRVGLALVLKSFRHFAKVLVQYCVVAVEPVGGYFLLAVVGNGIYVMFQIHFEPVMHDDRFARQGVRIGGFWHDAMTADDNGVVVEITALPKIHLAVEHHVLDGAVDVILPHDKHLGEVWRVFDAVVHHLRFYERQRRETPARARHLLVLHGGTIEPDDVLEAKFVLRDLDAGLFFLRRCRHSGGCSG